MLLFLQLEVGDEKRNVFLDALKAFQPLSLQLDLLLATVPHCVEVSRLHFDALASCLQSLHNFLFPLGHLYQSFSFRVDGGDQLVAIHPVTTYGPVQPLADPVVDDRAYHSANTLLSRLCLRRCNIGILFCSITGLPSSTFRQMMSYAAGELWKLLLVHCAASPGGIGIHRGRTIPLLVFNGADGPLLGDVPHEPNGLLTFLFRTEHCAGHGVPLACTVCPHLLNFERERRVAGFQRPSSRAEHKYSKEPHEECCVGHCVPLSVGLALSLPPVHFPSNQVPNEISR
mmetsp:Transcript_231/g.736  ORF Transcript_231/g.736 Transcript_231/m.736 type:complete len:286 (-) Transcript_231:507-1364(-)